MTVSRFCAPENKEFWACYEKERGGIKWKPGILLNDGTTSNAPVSYQLSLLTDGDVCDQYAMVCSIDVTDPLLPAFEECDCYTFTGGGISPTGASCMQLSTQNTTGVDAPDLPSYNFATRSGFVTGTVAAPENGSSYVVQVITGEKTDCIPDIGTVGTFVDNFRIIETFDLTLECDGLLDGAENAFLTTFAPTAMAGQFNVLPGNVGGAGAALAGAAAAVDVAVAVAVAAAWSLVPACCC